MRAGFSLIELLVVVAIIGILAAVGVVGYQGYIDATKKEASLANGRQVARAIEQDWLSLANGINGTTELGNKLTIAGVELTTQVKGDSSCYKYNENIRQYLNETWKNAYDSDVDYAVNLHTEHANSLASPKTSIKPGQFALQCANICEPTGGNFYLHTCSCTGSEDCTLFNFSKADYETFIADSDCYPTLTASCAYDEGDAPRDAYDYYQFAETQALVSQGIEVWTGTASDANASRYVAVGTHMPDWLCPQPVVNMASSAVGCACDNPSDASYPCQ